jgi:trimeric autotransporter adhesin
VNLFPQLGGKSASDSNSVQAGYTVGYHKVTNIFNANWNRSNSQTTNFFTNGTTLPRELGILCRTMNSAQLRLPNVQLSNSPG